MDNALETQIKGLAEMYIAGELSAEDGRRLEELLGDSTAARLLFLSYLEVHAGMAWETRGATIPLPVSPLPPPSQKAPAQWRMIRRALPFAAALALLAGWLQQRFIPAPGSADRSLATITRSLHGRWTNGREVQPAESISSGAHQLQSGLLELTTPSGVKLLLEGPSSIEWIEPTRIRLLAGNIVVRMPKGESGFVVETSLVKVTDLGTEFGVGLNQEGQTQVQVFSGRVFTELSGLDAGRELKSGDTLVYSRAGEIFEPVYSEDRFIRRFPKIPPPQQAGGALYNESRTEAITAFPAPENMVLDADLSEWKHARGFRSACLPPYGSTYFVEGMMMYDDRNLYLAAHVGDPDPMLNASRPGMEFAGGSVVVRLCTERAAGWPLKGSMENARSKARGILPSPESLSTKVTSMVLWFDTKTSTPRLEVAHSFDFRTPSAPPQDWKGAFKKSPDGRGYTLEYAIPWALLNCAEAPPVAGDELAALWTVHWSDSEGRVCRGQLVDISNQTQQESSTPSRKIDPSCFFMYGPRWGKAVFVPQGK